MTKPPRIYLDHAATTPILPAAKAAMAEALERWANPSSPHAEGRAARAALEDARERIKRALGWTGELIFTSGATEAIEIALAGRGKDATRVSTVEHDAVMRHRPGFECLEVDRDGLVRPDGLAPFLEAREAADVFVIQHVNNETGVIQPVAELGSVLARSDGPSPVLLCDCAQSAGKVPLPPADLIPISSHKLGGPPGVGALLAKDLGRLTPSGGQERGYRGGTENLPAILGLSLIHI